MKTEAEADRAIRLYADTVRICFMYLKNYHDVEDVFQEVFLKYLLHDASFKSGAHEKAWLIRVAINACKDTLKSFFRKKVTSIDAITAEPFYISENHHDVLDAVLKLPDNYKNAVYLFYYEGYSAVEIAKILHKKENTVYTWLSRAKEKLSAMLGGAPLKNKIHNAFHEIKAEEQLKQDTYAFLKKKIKQRRAMVFKRFASALAAAAAVFTLGFVSHHLYFTEFAFVDIDVNPSIELTLNRFNRVIDVYAYNDDGKNVLDKTTIKNKAYEDALKALIDNMIGLGYIKEAGLFTATLQLKNGGSDQERLDSLKAYIDAALQSDNKALKQDVFLVDSDTKAHAHEHNLTPAKYLAILELQKVDPTATFEGCGDHTISTIKEQTHAHKNGQDHQTQEHGPKEELSGKKHNGHSLSRSKVYDDSDYRH